MCFVSFVPRTATFFQEARLFGSPSPKIRFFLATNLGWRSANAISYDLFKRTQEKYCLRCVFMLRNIVSRSCFCGNKIIRTFLFWIVRTFYLSITFCETLSLLQNKDLKQQRRRRQREAKTQ